MQAGSIDPSDIADFLSIRHHIQRVKVAAFRVLRERNDLCVSVEGEHIHGHLRHLRAARGI